jgi:hypothetical protein
MYLSKTYFNIIIHLCISVSSNIFSRGFQVKILHTNFMHIYYVPIRATCPANPNLIDLITLTNHAALCDLVLITGG